MTIRDLTLNDFDAVNNIFMQLHNLHVENRPDLYQKINKPNTTKAWDFEASLGDSNKIMLGACSDGKVVGFCIAETRQSEGKAFTPRTFVHIKNLAVDECHRKNGIGKALYYEAIKRAKARGAQAVDLKVFSFNEEAVAFYKSLGMTVQNCTMEQKI